MAFSWATGCWFKRKSAAWNQEPDSCRARDGSVLARTIAHAPNAVKTLLDMELHRDKLENYAVLFLHYNGIILFS